jgi:hypothetical protein
MFKPIVDLVGVDSDHIYKSISEWYSRDLEVLSQVQGQHSLLFRFSDVFNQHLLISIYLYGA